MLGNSLNSKEEHSSTEVSPSVAILLATYQGEAFLREQLRSIENQSYPYWYLHASDDNSDDATYDILQEFSRFHPEQVQLHRNVTNKGFARNFLSMLCNQKDVMADLYAFSDQDDIWGKDKLQSAVNWLRSIPANTPALYCTRTEAVDEQGASLMLSPAFLKPPSFANALVQNIASGNTMVFNQAARELILKASADCDVILHDWFAYIVVSGCGGEVFYDPKPSLKYRQHNNNVIGTNYNLWPRFIRFCKLLQGKYKESNEQHIQRLMPLRSYLTDRNKEIFDRFVEARKASLFKRLYGVQASGVYRQTRCSNLNLFISALLNKL